MDHFMNPRNVGELDDASGVGDVGNPMCGDIVRLFLKINGEKIESFSDMQRIVSISAGAPLTIEVDRDNAQVTLKAVPQLKEIKDSYRKILSSLNEREKKLLMKGLLG